MSILAPQIQVKTEDEIRNVAVDFTNKLDSGELLDGTPTVALESGSGLTFDDETVSVAALTILGRTVAIGMAVQFSVTGGTAGTQYRIVVTCGTNATPAQTLQAIARLEVV